VVHNPNSKQSITSLGPVGERSKCKVQVSYTQASYRIVQKARYSREVH
jgi:hypothetical protein